MHFSVSAFFNTQIQSQDTLGVGDCAAKQPHISGERTGCLEVLICEWEGRQKLGNPGLYLYPCFHTCIYKNMYTHRGKTKQSSRSSPGERAREQTSGRCEPCHRARCCGSIGTRWAEEPQSRRQQDTPRQEKTTRQRGPGGAGTLSSLGITPR